MNSEKTVELIRFDEATKEIDQITDIALNQLINNAVYTAINKYSEYLCQDKLSGDFDLQFFVEIMKDVFANKSLLKGILEGEDYRWPNDQNDSENVKNQEAALLPEHIIDYNDNKSFEKGKKTFDLFWQYFTGQNIVLAKRALKEAATQNIMFLGLAYKLLFAILDFDVIKQSQQVNLLALWKQAIEICRFINLEFPNYRLSKINLATAYINYGIFLSSQGFIDQAITIQKLACTVLPTEQVKETTKHNLAVCYFQLGIISNNNGNLIDAVDHMLTACTYKPNESTKHNVGVAATNLATHMLKNRNLDGAIEHFSLALDSGLILPEILNDLGVALASIKNLDAAILYFEKALEINSNAELAKINLQKAREDLQQDLMISEMPVPKFHPMEFKEYQAA